MNRIAAALLAVLALPGLALAGTRKVPSEQYPTIQSAIDGVQSGDVILVAKGTYAENLTISGNNPFTLKGKGKPVIDGGGGDCISLSFVSNISISGFVLTNTSEAIFATGCTAISISKVTIVNPGSRGMHFRNNSAAITVSKCSVTGSGNEGILDEESTGLVVSKCRFTNTGQAAVALSPNYFTDGSGGSDGAVVTKNRITGSGENSIHFGGDGVVVSKNRIASSGQCGIFNDPDTTTAGAVVAKNKVAASGIHGIHVAGSSATVSKNKVKDANQNGLEIRGSGGHTVEKNKVSAADVDGIHVVSSGNAFTKNKAKGNSAFDLGDDNAEGANAYDGNKFATTSFGSP